MIQQIPQRLVRSISQMNHAHRNMIFGARKTDEEDGRLKKICILQKLRQLVYSFYLFVVIVGVIVQSTKCLAVFLEGPTYTDIKSVPQMDAAFPGITVCPLKNGLNESVLKVSLMD